MATATEKRKKLKLELLSPGTSPAIGVYDVLSSRIAEAAGFPVLYLGSYATAASMLGQPDTGLNTLNDIVELARRIVDASDLPMVSDAEGGFFTTANLWRTVRDYERAGISGMHIEDQVFGKHTPFPVRVMDKDKMCDRIKAAVDARQDENFMIIGRTEVHKVQGDQERIDAEVVERCNAYLEAGADAAFIASPGSVETIRKLRPQINGPVIQPARTMDSLALQTEIGVDMVIYWQFMIWAAYVGCSEAAKLFAQNRDYSSLGKYVYHEAEFNKMIQADEFFERVRKFGAE